MLKHADDDRDRAVQSSPTQPGKNSPGARRLFPLLCLALCPIAFLLAGSGDGRADMPTKIERRSGESPIDAARRFSDEYFEIRKKLRDDFELYARDYIAGDSAADRFKLVWAWHKAYGVRPARTILLDFKKSPALSPDDRRQIDLYHDYSAAAEKLRRDYRALEARIATTLRENNKEHTVAQLSRLFYAMPSQVEAIESIKPESFAAYARSLRKSMIEQKLPQPVLDAVFKRPGTLDVPSLKARNQYDAFSIALSEASGRLPMEFYADMKQGWRPTPEFRDFLAAETTDGMRGVKNAELRAIGLYAALGDARLENFRKQLRVALQAAAAGKP